MRVSCVGGMTAVQVWGVTAVVTRLVGCLDCSLARRVGTVRARWACWAKERCVLAWKRRYRYDMS